MKLMLAALAATLAIAITASVVAIWASVANAPWEDAVPTPAPTVDASALLRCQEALDLRQEASARVAGELEAQGEARSENLFALAETGILLRERELGRRLNTDERIELLTQITRALPATEPVLAEQQIEMAEREIDRYC